MSCSKCAKVESCNAPGFRMNDLDFRRKCQHCGGKSAVYLWRCPCGKRCHACDVHSHAENTENVCKANGQPHIVKSSRRRRRVPKLRYVADILDDDDRKECKRKAQMALSLDEVDLGKPIHGIICANLLSPNLVKRFKGSVCTL